MTSQRLAHWVKEILSKAGVNTEVFKAHSVRAVFKGGAGGGGESPPLKLPQRNIYIMMYISIINNLQLHHDRRKIEWTSTALYPS